MKLLESGRYPGILVNQHLLYGNDSRHSCKENEERHLLKWLVNSWGWQQAVPTDPLFGNANVLTNELPFRFRARWVTPLARWANSFSFPECANRYTEVLFFQSTLEIRETLSHFFISRLSVIFSMFRVGVCCWFAVEDFNAIQNADKCTVWPFF